MAALKSYVSETDTALRQKPSGPTAPPRQAALACVADDALRANVCQHALQRAHTDLKADISAAGDKALTTAQIESLATAIARDLHSCQSLLMPPDDACRAAQEIAEFDIARLRRTNASLTEDKFKEQAAQLRKVASDSCNAAVEVQKARLAQGVCEYKQRHLTDFLRTYYGRNVLETLAAGQEGAPRLEIIKATFGDLRHGHTCNATRYFERRCRTLQGTLPTSASDADEFAGVGFCLIRRTGKADEELRSEFCGFDPSPQADLKLKIDYTCDGEQKSLTVPGSTGKINLICKLPENPRHLRLVDASKPADELKFFKAEPCAVKFE